MEELFHSPAVFDSQQQYRRHSLFAWYVLWKGVKDSMRGTEQQKFDPVLSKREKDAKILILKISAMSSTASIVVWSLWTPSKLETLLR